MEIFVANDSLRKERLSISSSSSLYIPYTSWCFTKWPTIYAETVGYASHSLETIFTNPFNTTCLVQLMFGKPCYKSEFKLIQAYSNRLGYCRSQTCQTCWYLERRNMSIGFCINVIRSFSVTSWSIAGV
jgi:hypothetical protein